MSITSTRDDLVYDDFMLLTLCTQFHSVIGIRWRFKGQRKVGARRDRRIGPRHPSARIDVLFMCPPLGLGEQVSPSDALHL